MATLSADELAKLRQECARTLAVDYDKPKINAALQAIEDWAIANAAALSSAINTATSPFTFSAAQKKKLFAEWCFHKFNKDK